MKRLILHLGAHRCGSTALQSLLARERKAIAEAGAAVILRADTEAGGLNLRRLHRYRAQNPFWRLKLRRAVGVARRLPQNTVIISDENLMGTMPMVRGSGFYPYFDHLVAGIGRLAILLGDEALIEPRLVVRRQDRYLESVYAFRVSRGLKAGFDDFIRDVMRERICWHRLAGALGTLPDNVRPRIGALEAWPKHTGAVQALAFLGLEDVTLTGGTRLMGNRRHSARELALMLALNRAGVAWRKSDWFKSVRAIAADSDAALLRALGEYLPHAELDTVATHFDPAAKVAFAAEERAHLLADYSEDNAAFFKHPLVAADPSAWDEAL